MTYEDIVKALRDERFYDYDICQALKCGEFCENADCIFVQAADAIESLTADNKSLRNELCLKCGRYKMAHEGACDGCRWKK